LTFLHALIFILFISRLGAYPLVSSPPCPQVTINSTYDPSSLSPFTLISWSVTPSLVYTFLELSYTLTCNGAYLAALENEPGLRRTTINTNVKRAFLLVENYMRYSCQVSSHGPNCQTSTSSSVIFSTPSDGTMSHHASNLNSKLP
jgi:hypothetical protein